MFAESYVFKLNEEAKQYAEEVLNESEETRNSALREIKQWLQENSHLHGRTSNKYILPFLRRCKFNLDITQQKLTNFYTMKRDRPEWFTNRNPLLPEIQELVKMGVFVPLNSMHENRLVVIIRPAVHDPKKHSIQNVVKTGNMILDIAAFENESAQIYGVAAIIDMQGIGFGHARQLTPSVITNIVYAWQNYHCRPKKMECINAPLYINVVLNVFKSFMSEKLRSRVQVHFNGLGKLHEVIDLDILPPEYGGNGETMTNLINYWNERLVESTAWFADDEKYKAE